MSEQKLKNCKSRNKGLKYFKFMRKRKIPKHVMKKVN